MHACMRPWTDTVECSAWRAMVIKANLTLNDRRTTLAATHQWPSLLTPLRYTVHYPHVFYLLTIRGPNWTVGWCILSFGISSCCVRSKGLDVYLHMRCLSTLFITLDVCMHVCIRFCTKLESFTVMVYLDSTKWLRVTWTNKWSCGIVGRDGTVSDCYGMP